LRLLTSQSADGQGIKLYLAGENAHQSFNGKQRCCVVAQVGAGVHDGIDLFDGGLWLGFFSQSADLGF
jgi:hypothetical protein